MGQRVVSPSLRHGFIWTSLAAALTLLEGAAEAVRLGAGFNNVRAHPTASRSSQRCTPNLRATPTMPPTPNSYSVEVPRITPPSPSSYAPHRPTVHDWSAGWSGSNDKWVIPEHQTGRINNIDSRASVEMDTSLIASGIEVIVSQVRWRDTEIDHLGTDLERLNGSIRNRCGRLTLNFADRFPCIVCARRQ